MNALLEVENLMVDFRTYGGIVQAVRGVSFQVRQGETVGIVGESGCGKSVTAKSIMKLLSEPPAHYKNGRIRFNGKDLLSASERELENVRGNDISMIFQDPMTSLNPTAKVGYQIMETLMKHHRMPKSIAYEKALQALKEVGIPQPEKRMKQYPHEFSGGMRQRVMIAMALVCRPQLIIADEPTTALDVTIQAQILELMKEIQEQHNTSIILITHDLGVVAEMCDVVVVMYAGKIVETGKIQDIFKKPRHPYTQGLLKSIPRFDMDRNKALSPIIGSPPDLFAPPKGCSFYSRCECAMKVCRDYEPELEEVSDGQLSACWLNHPFAQKIKATPNTTRKVDSCF
ncbi:MAG: ABC transporter ATP-binding protein [Bacillus sp. (in: firmicutes)]